MAIQETVLEGFRISPQQRRLWRLCREGDLFRSQIALAITGPLRAERLQDALADVAARHEALRTRMASGAGLSLPLQVVERTAAAPDLERVDLSALPAAEAEARLSAWLEAACREDIDVGETPAWRAGLARLAANRHVLALTLPALLADGPSLACIAADLGAFYADAEPDGEPLQYADYAEWQIELQESGREDDARARQAMPEGAGGAALALPFALPADGSLRYEPLALERPSAAAAEAIGRAAALGVSAEELLLGAFGALLGRLSGCDQLTVACRVDGRDQEELAGAVGLLSRWMPVTWRQEAESGFAELLGQVRDAVEDAAVWAPYFLWDEGSFPEVGFGVDQVPEAIAAGEVSLAVRRLDAVCDRCGLELRWQRTGTSWSARWRWDPARYRREDVECLARRQELLLAALAEDPSRRLTDLPLLLEEERRAVVVAPAGAAAPRLVHHFFEEAARRAPEAPAVSCGAAALTYAELDTRANRLAHHLIVLGVGPETRVAIGLERSQDGIVALLAVLKAGGAYVPFEVAQPGARLAAMLEDAGARVVVTQESLRPRLASWTGSRLVVLDGAEREEIASRPAGPPAVAVDGANLAYVIFTSGSTGRPKGVAVEHRQLARYVDGVLVRLALPAGASFATVSTLAADLGHTAIFPALCTGGHLHVVPADQVADPAALAALFRAAPVDCLKIVPSHLRSLLASPQASDVLPRCCLVLGGEACSCDLVAQVRELAPGCRVLNHYGPTETTVGVLVHEPGPREGWDPRCATVPLGLPLAGARVRVLDGALRAVPSWTTGDLAIGGATVSRGYLGRPDLTAERFVPDPLAAEPGARLYRTGDLARVVSGGLVEFLGRGDQQVKIRGFRVELEEVRAALLRHPEVSDGAALLRPGRDGQSFLVAFYAGPRPLEARELRERMAESLPEEVLPNFFVHLARLPLTANGKLDAAALPAIEEIQRGGGKAPAGPRTTTEAALARLWTEVLGVDQVDIEVRFFDLGGHSLLATRLIARAQEILGVALPLRRFLEEPTVAGMAMAVARVKAERREEGAPPHPHAPLVPRPHARFDPFPLNEVQQAYWVGRLGAFELGNVGTHTYFEFERRELDLPRFERALRALIERHDMLRAVVLPDGSQRVLERVPPYQVKAQDLRGRGPHEVEAALAAVRKEMSEQVLAPEAWPLFDFRVSLLDGGRVRLHISRDALIFDAWSAALVFGEWARLYRDPAAELPALELTFRDYVLAEREFQRTETYGRSLDYWLRRLPTLAPAPELPLARNPATLDRPRFVHRGGRLAAGEWQRLKRRAARAGLTPSGLVAAVFAEVLAAWSKSPRFTLNLTLFHRLPLHPQVESVVGDFTSMVLLEVDPLDGAPFELRARQVQERLWEDLEHRDVSGVRVLRELARVQRRAPGVLMPVVLTSLLAVGDPERERERRELLGEMVWGVGVTSQVWLDHAVMEVDSDLVFNWNAVDELFPPGLLDAAFAAYAALLARLAGEEEAWSATSLDLVPAAQRTVRDAANATAAPLPRGLLHEPFLARAAEQPERAAVIAGEATLGYGELARRANRLAHRLRELGARPGRLVAVVMEKGCEQVVATLGVLGAGAAYLPVDPSLPAERRLHLLASGQAEVALTQSWLDEELKWPVGLVRIAVDTEPPADGPDTAPAPLQRPLDLAYVLFTSGSTGWPKGVMIDHQGALNTVIDVNRRFGVGVEDRVLALSSLSFDLSVWDVFGMLAAGGALVLPEPAAARDPARWAALVARHGVTVWNSVPALLEMLIEYAAGHPEVRLDGLRLVLLSGDWIPLSLPDRLRALAPHARVVSLGGATEASIWSILYPIERVEEGWASIPYGRPMDNQTFHVLDPRLEPRPDWVPGELYIGGVGLAQGYWQDEEKTQAAFLRRPQGGERLYRTGDLGRWLPDGTIEFLGREDQQVKIQGHRIELGEIEAALEQHPAVRAHVVAAPGARDSRRLVAYVVAESAAPLEGAEPPRRITGALERLEFKLREPGLRADLDGIGRPAVALEPPILDASAIESLYLTRRTRRRFLPEPVPFAVLSGLLSALLQARPEGSPTPRYRYGSASGLYPVQTYVWIKPGRVESLGGGAYYYHPREHRLVELAPASAGEVMDRQVYSQVNRPVFDAAAFAILLVGQMRAIEPLYGDAGRHYAAIEAGLMTQLLDTWAPGQGIGLCQIGGLDFERLRGALALDDGHVLLHSLLGGGLDRRADRELEASAAESRKLLAGLAPQPPAPAAGRGPLAEELKRFLRGKLPEYMVPASWVFLEALPLTANGKVDRGALPPPDAAETEEPAPRLAPASEPELRIAAVWREVLGLDEVGIEDNFFDLGGNSVGMVQAYAKLRHAFARELQITDLFRCPTIASLAELAARAPGADDDSLAESRRQAARQRAGIERQRRLTRDRTGRNG